jgi:hypothetical protein
LKMEWKQRNVSIPIKRSTRSRTVKEIGQKLKDKI